MFFIYVEACFRFDLGIYQRAEKENVIMETADL